MANEDKIFELMTQMYTEFQGFKKEVNSKFEDISGEIKGFKEEVNGKFEDISGEIKGFKKEVNGKVEDVGGEIKGFKKEVNDKFEDVSTELKELKNEASAIHRTVIKIENEHGEKLSALFDGWKQNTDQLARIENQVSRQEEVILRKIK